MEEVTQVNKCVSTLNEKIAKYKSEQFMEGCLRSVKAYGNLSEMVEDGLKGSDLYEKYGCNYVNNKKKIDRCVNEIRNEKYLKRIKIEMEDAVLRPWQEKMVKALEKEDEKKIMFVIDEDGNSGKTWLGTYLKSKGAFVVPTTCASVVKCYKYEDTVVFDLTCDTRRMNYKTIECFKDGGNEWKRFDSCKVLVMMRKEPFGLKSRMDRYDIWRLRKDEKNGLELMQ